MRLGARGTPRPQCEESPRQPRRGLSDDLTNYSRNQSAGSPGPRGHRAIVPFGRGARIFDA
jgi:hypothetical protein